MTRRLVTLGSCAAVGVLLAASTALAGHTFTASLIGERSVPGPGDPDGAGYAIVTVDGSDIYYSIVVRNIVMPTASHIHAGVAGTSGGVFVGFTAPWVELDSGVWATRGAVAADEATVNALVALPRTYYVNVHNAEFGAGAIRGQLAGDSASTAALVAFLGGAAEVGQPGDADGFGAAMVLASGDDLFYCLLAVDVAAPTAAHIHTGAGWQNGGVRVGFPAAFEALDGRAFASMGKVSANEGDVAAIWGGSRGFYVNIHNPDHPAGAMRGQLQASETRRVLPVAAATDGLQGTRWGTGVRIANLTGTDATVIAGWYPSGPAGMEEPTVAATLTVPAGAELALDDLVGSTFGTFGTGAVTLVSSHPFAALARIFNDQTGNPQIGGTYGQGMPAVAKDELGFHGALLGLANRPAGDGEGFRTNLGFFNPGPDPATATFTAVASDGTVLGSVTLEVPAGSHQQANAFDVITSVAAQDRTQARFMVAYSVAGSGLFVYGSVVDNVTGDAVTVLPQPPQ